MISLKRSTRSWIGFIDGPQVLADRLVEIQLRLLGHVPHAHVLGQGGGAVDIGIDAGHDPQEGRLSRPVLADDADFRAVVERQADILEHDALAVALAERRAFRR